MTRGVSTGPACPIPTHGFAPFLPFAAAPSYSKVFEQQRILWYIRGPSGMRVLAAAVGLLLDGVGTHTQCILEEVEGVEYGC